VQDTNPGLVELAPRRKREAFVKKLSIWLPIAATLIPAALWLGVLRVPWATIEQLDALEKRLDQKMTNLPAELVKALRGEKEK
jgi:hypothetical protein